MDHEKKPDETEQTTAGMSRRGEEVSGTEQEPGRKDMGKKGETERPMGTSTARDYTGVDPQEPKDGGSPAG